MHTPSPFPSPSLTQLPVIGAQQSHHCGNEKIISEAKWKLKWKSISRNCCWVLFLSLSLPFSLSLSLCCSADSDIVLSKTKNAQHRWRYRYWSRCRYRYARNVTEWKATATIKETRTYQQYGIYTHIYSIHQTQVDSRQGSYIAIFISALPVS